MINLTQRSLDYGRHQLAARDQAQITAPYMLAGKKMYALGCADGSLGPIGVEHLVNEMGGIWAHPIKVAEGWQIRVRIGDQPATSAPATSMHDGLDRITWRWQEGPLAIERCDQIAADDPAYFVHLRLHNRAKESVPVAIEAQVQLKFLGCWFGNLPSGPAHYQQAGQLVIGSPELQPEWGVAVGLQPPASQVSLQPGAESTIANLRWEGELGAEGTYELQALLCAASHGGPSEAVRLWQNLSKSGCPPRTSLADEGHPQLHSEQGTFERDFSLALANFRLLEADYPHIGRYFLAGLPEYPQLFGCDTTYSVPGALAAGFTATTKAALEQLAAYGSRACGRIPHEITTNGRVFHPGNIQETPQFTIACADYLRWTGDLATIRELYPLCREGMLELLPTHGGDYPIGDGMVERHGMGALKLDAVCYHYAGLVALAEMAAALGDEEALALRQRAERLQTRFERDWWIEDEQLYADSRHLNGENQLDGHWTIVLPVQLGLASPTRAEAVLDRIEREWLNQWGLVHTRTHEELVWTLPTGLLALAAFRHGRAELGWHLTCQIAGTAEHGTPGTFKELIPVGLCFVQLWSAALYVQAVVEGLFGISPVAYENRLHWKPNLPSEIGPLHLSGVPIGEHRFDFQIDAEQCQITHQHGPNAFTVSFAEQTVVLEPGQGYAWSQEKGGQRL